jgi:hypothetical protein
MHPTLVVIGAAMPALVVIVFFRIRSSQEAPEEGMCLLLSIIEARSHMIELQL